MRVVIVGGVAGGMSAATRLRRLSEKTEIIVLEKGPYVSFANCGLPYHISGEIADREDLIVQSPEQLRRRFNIDVRANNEVIQINRKNKTVKVNNPNGEYELSYDALLLSPGAKPVIPPIAGIEKSKNIFTLRNIPDMDAIINFVKEEKPKRAVVIGAGFIGLETVENLRKIGLEVTLVEAKNQVMPTLDIEMAKFIEQELERNDVKVLTGISVNAFKDNGRIIGLSNGETLSADVIVLSIGVMPDSSIAKEAGLQTGVRGGIVVDSQYRTSDKDIYAVGDAILVKHHITKEPTLISLASPANRQGRQVADILMHKKRENRGSLGTSIIRVFDLVAASTGLTETQLQEKGVSYGIVHIVANNHAGYFPGATSITIKLVFNKTTGVIYGAQAVGKEGVDKRIDILATAIKAGLTVEDLPELEFTYAPPFGSAKDPVNMIGYAALNIIEGVSQNIQYYELEKEMEEGAFVIDVRTQAEIKRFGSIASTINIPVDTLREHLEEIPKDKKIIVSCHSGLRSYMAERILKNHGYQVKNLDGAFHMYSLMYPEKIEYKDKEKIPV